MTDYTGYFDFVDGFDHYLATPDKWRTPYDDLESFNTPWETIVHPSGSSLGRVLKLTTPDDLGGGAFLGGEQANVQRELTVGAYICNPRGFAQGAITFLVQVPLDTDPVTREYHSIYSVSFNGDGTVDIPGDTSASVLSAAAWNYVEASFRNSSWSGSIVNADGEAHVYVDGVEVLSATDLTLHMFDTTYDDLRDISVIKFSTGHTLYLDHLYVRASLDPAGPMLIKTYLPSAAGAWSDIDPRDGGNYAKVNVFPPSEGTEIDACTPHADPDDDTDDADTYRYTWTIDPDVDNVAVVAGNIYAIQLRDPATGEGNALFSALGRDVTDSDPHKRRAALAAGFVETDITLPSDAYHVRQHIGAKNWLDGSRDWLPADFGPDAPFYEFGPEVWSSVDSPLYGIKQFAVELVLAGQPPQPPKPGGNAHQFVYVA